MGNQMPETYGDISKVLIQVPIWVTGPVLGEYAVEKAFKVWRWIMYVRIIPQSLVVCPGPYMRRAFCTQGESLRMSGAPQISTQERSRSGLSVRHSHCERFPFLGWSNRVL